MASKRPGPVRTALNRAGAIGWRRAAREAWSQDMSILRRQRAEARGLRVHLDRLIATADERLSLPSIGNSAFPRPHGTDWAWRPQLWREPLPIKGLASVESRQTFGDELTVFHDCTVPEIALRQVRNLREEDLAAYGLRVEVLSFDGSFLSLVLDLPPEAAQGLRKRHLIRLEAAVGCEAPLEIFARLNVRHGPNTEQIVRELPLGQSEVAVEFDLAYTNLNEKRAEKIWLDLIVEGSAMNEVTIRDLTLCRFPRAEL